MSTCEGERERKEEAKFNVYLDLLSVICVLLVFP